MFPLPQFSSQCRITTYLISALVSHPSLSIQSYSKCIPSKTQPMFHRPTPLLCVRLIYLPPFSNNRQWLKLTVRIHPLLIRPSQTQAMLPNPLVQQKILSIHSYSNSNKDISQYHSLYSLFLRRCFVCNSTRVFLMPCEFHTYSQV